MSVVKDTGKRAILPPFGEEHEALRETVRRFVSKEIAPHVPEWEEAREFPRELYGRCAELGFLGLKFPEEYGGQGGTHLHDAIWVEELARSGGSGGVAAGLNAHTSIAMPPIFNFGTEEQKQRWLVPGIAGQKIGALGITEPGAGSDVAGIRTSAVRSADGSEWILNGTKLFITNGVHADLYFIAAKTGSGTRAMSMFAVEKGTPGFSVGRKLDKSGWLSSDTAELVFADCRIPAAALLGEENRGFYSVMKNFQTERIALAAMAVGHSMQALQATLAHVRDRRAFGATLFDKQAVRQRLAMLDAKVRAARSFMYHCAWRVTQGHDVVQEVSMLKALTGELVNEVVSACQQFHGGMGYMRGTVIERLWRDARVLAIGGGATEVMLDEVAKRY
jgi:acyl-CoA dehydrogenase